MKIHLSIKRPFNAEREAACGRGIRISEDVHRVDCRHCQKTDIYIIRKDEDTARRHDAFMAQEPRTFGEPWKDGLITCNNGHDRFREGDRSCYGHYANYVCSECGDVQSRLTETGMAF